MTNKLTYFDGKAYAILDDTPGLWTYFTNAPRTNNDTLYARVAAAYRAYNLKANTIGAMPFTLTNLKGGEEYDNSRTWENKCKFMPNPSELFRLDTLSYMVSNSVYNLMSKDVLGYKDKRLRNAVPYSFTPVTNIISGDVDYIERRVGTTTERYSPTDGKRIDGGNTAARLIYMWRLDHTTEVLPSPATEAQAIMNASGVIYHADSWIRHFFERGGVVPMIIAMKGAVSVDKKEQEEKSWSKWYLGLRDAFSRIFRVVNAEALDVKEVGKGIEQLKDSPTYQQALSNIAMGTGMPLSLLMANSANYATAKEEKATWYDNDITPFCNWLAYEYNEQVFHPIGLHLQFHPETLDPQQEDETQRAVAISTFMDFLGKCPTLDLFLGTCETFGYELTDSLRAAAEKYYADKAKRAEEIRAQTQPKEEPKADAQPEPQPTTDTAQADEAATQTKATGYENKTAANVWTPNLDELDVLREWRSFALRSLNKGKPLAEPYKKADGALPEEVVASVMASLSTAKTDEEVKAAFEVEGVTHVQKETTADPAIMALAAAINKLADKQGVMSNG